LSFGNALHTTFVISRKEKANEKTTITPSALDGTSGSFQS